MDDMHEILREAIEEEEHEAESGLGGAAPLKKKRNGKELQRTLILKKLMRHDKKTQLTAQKEVSSRNRAPEQEIAQDRAVMLRLADLVLGPECSEELEQAANAVLGESVGRRPQKLLDALKEKNREFLFQQPEEELSANSFETRDCSLLDQIGCIIDPEEFGSPILDHPVDHLYPDEFGSPLHFDHLEAFTSELTAQAQTTLARLLPLLQQQPAVPFATLAQTNTRKEAAALFLEMLALRSQGKVHFEQDLLINLA